MLFCKSKCSLGGFTLIESMLGIMIIGLVSGSIMVGLTTIEKKLFEIRLKEHAFEELRNYTNFLGSRIAVGEIPGTPPSSGINVVIYQKEVNNFPKNIYTATMNYVEQPKRYYPDDDGDGMEDYCPLCNGEIYHLETWIDWPNESDIKHTLKFDTYQIKLTN
jgi:type II secretory pathway pseudopilin PulG